MNIKKLRKNKKGFTLIEIIVVVVILAVLFAVAVPSVMKYINEADDAKYLAQTRGAFSSCQIEIAKAYADSDGLTAEELELATGNPTEKSAYKKVVDALDGTTPRVTDVVAYTSDTATLKAGDKPEMITKYVVNFADAKDKKQAVIVPNGNITLNELQ